MSLVRGVGHPGGDVTITQSGPLNPDPRAPSRELSGLERPRGTGPREVSGFQLLDGRVRDLPTAPTRSLTYIGRFGRFWSPGLLSIVSAFHISKEKCLSLPFSALYTRAKRAHSARL